MPQLLAPSIVFTYGVVKRAQNILSSADFKEFDSVKNKLSDLCVELPQIYREIRALVYSYPLENCLQQLRASIYDMEDILEVAATDHQLQQKLGRPPRWSVYDYDYYMPRFMKQVSFVASELDELRSSFSTAGSIESIADHPAFLSSTRENTGASSLLYYDGSEVFGRESEKKRVLDWIFNPPSVNRQEQQHPNVFSIVGLEGMGKTTLAKMIYNDAVQASTSFDIVSWVDMAPSAFELGWDLRSIIALIIGSFPNQSRYYTQRMDKEKLEHILRDLLQGRKYLLVLDDCTFRGAEWDSLMKILRAGSAGSTVIVTTRQIFFGMSHGIEFAILRGLNASHCRSLLFGCAGFNEEEQTHRFEETMKYLVEESDGCPLAFKTLGRILRNSRDMKIEEFRCSKYEGGVLGEAFAESLKCMPYDMAQCAVGSVVSPENKAMSRDQLIYLWMAQGLLQSREINEDPIDIGYGYCNELSSVAFLRSWQTDGHDIILRLHEEARKLALAILGATVAAIDAPFISNGSRHLTCNGGQSYLDQGFAPGHLQLPWVRTFMLNCQVGRIGKPFLEELISKLTHARVLLLDGSEFEELPESIGNLKLLRYLSLTGNHSLKLLPESICNLLNLQTLDLSGCEQLQTLPKMDALSNLRHLLLSVKLTTLPEEAIRSWTSLHHLKICNCPNLSSISEEIAHLTALRVLQVHDCPLIASLPNSIKQLTLLKELRIRNCEMLDLTKWDGLEGLKVLKFLQFQGLPELSKFPEGLQTCTNLSELIIDNCPNMGTLPKGIQAIKALQLLKIVDCPTLISRCQPKAGEDPHLFLSGSTKIQLQIRNRGISPFKIHPGAMSGEKRSDQQEDEAGPSSQVAGHHSPNEKEKMKDWRCSILFLLPENYEIERDTLIQLWIAGKYIKGEPMEQQEEKFFGTLVREGYLSRCGTDFMRGKGRYRVEIEKLNELQLDDQQDTHLKWDNQYQADSSSPAADSVQHVSLVCNDIDETVFQALQQFTNLRTLLFFANRGHRVKPIPDHLFSGLNNLQALDLSRTNLRELPSSVGHMIQLRYMNLSCTLIERLPDTVCSLVELQTLKLRGCSNLRELPEQLARLTKLRHLDVDALRQLETMPKGIGALVNLRTLPAFLVGTEDGRRIQELKELNNLSGSLCIAKLEHASAKAARKAALDEKQHLEKLELRWTASELSGTHNDSYDILECLHPCTSLEELQILCYEGSRIPRWIGDVEFDELARIVFYRCENLLKLPLIEQLPHLKHLELIMMNSVEKIERRGELEKGVFPALEKLEIDDMQSLNVWDWKKRNKSDFKSLAQLIINDCPELVEFDVLPHLSSIKHFDIRECPKLLSLSNTVVPSSLEELIVEDCPKIQERCKNGGEDWFKIQAVPTKRIQTDDEDESQDESDDEEEDEGEGESGTTCIQAVPTKYIQKEDNGESEDESPDEVKPDEFPTAGTSSQAAVQYSPNETTLNQPNREHQATHEVQQISSKNDNLQEHDTTNEDQQTPPITIDQTTTGTENLQMDVNLGRLEHLSHKILRRADITDELALPLAIANHIFAPEYPPKKDFPVFDMFDVEWRWQARLSRDRRGHLKYSVYGEEWSRFIRCNGLREDDELVFYGRRQNPTQMVIVVHIKRAIRVFGRGINEWIAS